MILHKIKGWLYDNPLTPDPNDYTLRIISEKSLSIEDISRSAVTRGGADISEAAMTHAVKLWLKEMAYRACDGFSINTGWFRLQAWVKGVFNSPTERFNPEKHSIGFDFQMGTLLRKELAALEVEILGVADKALFIAQVTDVKTGSVNDLLTPGRNLRIHGTRIRIAGNHPTNGVWFVKTDTETRVKVDETDIVTNNPSELIIVIPELQAGEYRLEVVSQFGGNSQQLLKAPRTAVFDKTLTVE